MKPQGQKVVSFPSKKDIHPRNGFKNWWEDIVSPSKKRDRQNAKKEIEKAVEDS